MSYCPQRLVRSRFSAGLPSWDPHHRWYRPRTGFQAARASSNDASNSRSLSSYPADTVVTHPTLSPSLNDRRLTNVSWEGSSSVSDLKSSFHPVQTSRHDQIRSQSLKAPQDQSPHSEYEPDASTPGSRRQAFGRFRGVLSIPERSNIFGSGSAPKIVYNTKVVINGHLRDRQRVLHPSAVALEKRIRYQSLFYSGAEVRKWRLACSDLYRSKFYEREMENELLITLKLDSVEQILLEKLKIDSLGRFREAWESLSKREKSTRWHKLSLWVLKICPEYALDFLLVTNQSKDRPVFVMVADAFLFLDAFHYDTLKRWRNGTHTYQSVLQSALRPSNWPILFLPQKGVRLFVKRASREAVHHAFQLVRQRKIHTKAETYLCFMWRFTELGDIDKALEALGNVQRMRQADFQLDSDAVKRHCCKLLTLDSVQEGPNGRNFYILPKLLEKGVRPDRDMMNIVLSNAFKTGDEQLGLDMLEYMRANGYEWDSYTYLTLLNDAVARGDRNRVTSLVREVEPDEELQKNPWIASKIFHAHFVFTGKHINPDDDPDAVFYSMLDMYNQLHDITPLKELSILPPEYTPPPGGDNTPPTPIALYLMIATYLRCRKRVSIGQRLYSIFRSLVLQGHPAIAPLAATDHTYNEFLIAFRDNPRGLRPAMRVVEDMLQSSAQNETDLDPRGSPASHARPSARTWTILMSCFVYNNQPHAAEKVKEMMAEHNIDYNKATWNVMVSNHANRQNVSDLAKTIKSMEDEGFIVDSYNMKSLRYLRDPERLWVALEELDKMAEPPINKLASSKSSARVTEKKKSDQLLDRGLRRLSEKMKPKL
ncbi:pentatricopeptide repeat protein [Aspergillus clavatus NRRL 1]|uniref:Pentatricopeptide repeat protein n=1 Tax=Aspergillus clavatus (strain ATCC 1007 / CBS 513.65 / DSM 816 / NCTC 3887 / NRRL 1 / QM 1276 / 107) TaxID=344612 RepID=A1CQH5_ASPCL|nr:pentatricopeptide repeat protein [Aspergillus clavatus NRRL 1]EAW07896.1 pentatricopeptide repeat protein [Aspergillus clavatus NRRL 1]